MRMRGGSVLLMVWLAAGCSWSVGDASRDKLLEMVPGLFEQATGVPADHVNCPGAEDKSKNVLDCVVTAGSMDVKVRVLLGSDAPGMPEGQNINIEVTEKIVYGRNQVQSIREVFQAKGLTFDTLTCPGLTKVTSMPVILDCSGTVQGVAVQVQARVFENDAKYKVTKGVVDVDAIVGQLQAHAVSRGIPGKVTCEKSLHVMVPNSSFLCTGGGDKLRIKIDGAGNLQSEPELVP
jgi:hypothetical protein